MMSISSVSNRRIKKRLAAALILMVALIMTFTGCGKSGSKKDSGKKTIVCTVFPEYDWVKEIIKGCEDRFDVKLLMKNGADLHNYQSTADDILMISECDMFIYVGGESDKWVDDALSEAVNKNMIVINLMDILGDRAKEEELVDGMQESEHDHDHDDADHEEDADHDDADHEEDVDHADADHEDDADHDDAEHEEDADHDDTDHEEDADHDHDHEEPEYDEHVWLSLKNAELFVKYIEEKIETLDDDEESVKKYKENAEAYTAKLAELDKKYEETVGNAANKTIVFGDRFPFRYLVDDYGLDYYAAFIGCSAETEASFETIAFLSGKIDELSLKSILKIETSDGKIAETIKENTKGKDQTVLTLDSMQAVTEKDTEKGVSYYDIMQKNLEVLTQALN